MILVSKIIGLVDVHTSLIFSFSSNSESALKTPFFQIAEK